MGTDWLSGPAELPKTFQAEHKRLRGAQGGELGVCAGSHRPFSIKHSLRLGHQYTTDVLELFLLSSNGVPITERKAAFSIAVAFRGAIASELGVELGEFGCDIKPVTLSKKLKGYAIVIFDVNASGYCSSVIDRIPALLRRARKALDCSNNCLDSCQHCLLSFDTRFRLDDLNRFDGLDFLSDRWLQDLELPPENAFFGAGKSSAEFLRLPEAITRELSRAGASELRVYLGGSTANWDVPVSSLRRWVPRWAAGGAAVLLVLPRGTLEQLPQADRFALKVLTSIEGVSACIGSPPACSNSAVCAAEVVAAGRSSAWAVCPDSATIPNANWGVTSEDLLVFGQPAITSNTFEPLEIEADGPSALTGKVVKLEIDNQLDGPAVGFGKRFLKFAESKIGGMILPGDSDVVGVRYFDRYLNSPAPAVLLVDLIAEIKNTYRDRWGVGAISISVSPFREELSSTNATENYTSNWPTSNAKV
jgi:hypothetical protein